ncbi:hypothetical protein V6N13_054223 [Hibiscus sabdariffa]
MRFNFFNTKIPSKLANLTYLRVLDFTKSNLQGHIPYLPQVKETSFGKQLRSYGRSPFYVRSPLAQIRMDRHIIYSCYWIHPTLHRQHHIIITFMAYDSFIQGHKPFEVRKLVPRHEQHEWTIVVFAFDEHNRGYHPTALLITYIWPDFITGLSDEEEAFAINLWNNRFDWLPEDCTPIEGNNFNCSPEYTEWFNNNGKPFLVAHEVSQRWHTEQRCSYQHVGETFEPEQNWHQSPNNGVMDLNIEWSTWESRTEPIRHVVGSSSSSNPWEEPIYNYPTVGETTYEHTQVSSSEPRNVFEQSPVQTNFGASSSSYAFHDDDVYRPQFDYPQPSTYGQSMGVDSVTCWLSTTTISTPSFAQDMYSTPPPMQTMDDQLNQDEQTPDLLHQRRMVNPPRRYDQTSSLHRQVLPRRKG